MDIHVVQPGDTMYQLSQQYGVSMDRLIQDNQLPDPSQLVVGQAIVVQYPELTHTVLVFHRPDARHHCGPAPAR